MDLREHVDAGSLFWEINAVFKKYGIGKGVGFVPDRLEVTIDRAPSGDYKLVYREFFTYLPQDVMKLALGNAVEFLSSLGVPRERIKQLERGVEVAVDGDARVVYFPMLEMLIQDKRVTKNVDVALDGLKNSLCSLMNLFDFAWEWDIASEELWKSNIARLNDVIEANPEIQSEIEEIVKKYTKIY